MEELDNHNYIEKQCVVCKCFFCINENQDSIHWQVNKCDECNLSEIEKELI